MTPARRVLGIPRAIARRVVAATATLFGVLTGHPTLETARDALLSGEEPA